MERPTTVKARRWPSASATRSIPFVTCSAKHPTRRRVGHLAEKFAQVRWSTTKNATGDQSSNPVRNPLGHRQPVQHVTHVYRDRGEFKKPLNKPSSRVQNPIQSTIGPQGEDQQVRPNSGRFDHGVAIRHRRGPRPRRERKRN